MAVVLPEDEGMRDRRVPLSPTRKSAARTRKKSRLSKPSSIALAFGHVLIRLRTARKLSIEDLSEKTSLPYSRVIALETSTREPHIDELFQLATSLGMPPSEFMKRVERTQQRMSRKAR